MGVRYTFADVDKVDKPHITKGAYRFGVRLYSFCCKGRASTGYGTTPQDAYVAWLRNWRRRHKFYAARESHANLILSTYHH